MATPLTALRFDPLLRLARLARLARLPALVFARMGFAVALSVDDLADDERLRAVLAVLLRLVDCDGDPDDLPDFADDPRLADDPPFDDPPFADMAQRESACP